MLNDPVQMLWIGDSISRLEYLCMQSFIANGHPVHLYIYRPIKNLPKKVICFDANEIVPENKIFRHKGSYAGFSDFFRWKLLIEKGGYYCDTDMLCIHPLNFDEPNIVGMESHNSVNAAFIRLSPNHPLALEMLDCALNPNKIKPYDTRRLKRKKLLKKITFDNNQIGWGETAGPRALTRAIQYMGINSNVSLKDFTYFYPIDCGNFNSLFNTTLSNEKLYKNTHTVHLWNEMLRRGGIDKENPFDPNSLIGGYFNLYCSDYKKA
ncbi:glycosyltransferase [Testudinibacter sp. P27/CKL/0425]